MFHNVVDLVVHPNHFSLADLAPLLVPIVNQFSLHRPEYSRYIFQSRFKPIVHPLREKLVTTQDNVGLVRIGACQLPVLDPIFVRGVLKLCLLGGRSFYSKLASSPEFVGEFRCGIAASARDFQVFSKEPEV